MIKSELVTRLQLKNPHMFQRDVDTVVNVFLDEIASAMRDRDRVEMRGFGAFSVRVRDARVGRNPRTGEPVDVAQKAAPFFRTGKEMRDRINSSEAVASASLPFADDDLSDALEDERVAKHAAE
ncbi:integration host factor subunit beta [Acuticoccus sp.]|uniref:integration host factor subunit beta n=1 Tax=Acuticoccus sp. TaxID=1904378 RepID=UPI003B52FA64